jgi:hypothetical protein
MTRRISRRRFMAASIAAAPCALLGRSGGSLDAWMPADDRRRIDRRALGFPVPERGWHGDSSLAAADRLDARGPRGERERPRRPPRPPAPPTETDLQRFAAQLAVYRDLPRHFIFEYYPWYQTDPWRHWDEGSRTPPDDIAAFAMPALGAYDSRDARAIEQHARWIAEMGVGAVNVSWWGPGSMEDRAVPLIMDVMRAHGIHVTFHLEPYSDTRSGRFRDDVLYLIREYGEKRRWDAFLLLEDAAGVARPVFKLFRAILPRTIVDCRGRVIPVPDFTEQSAWRRQIDGLRGELGAAVDPIILADSLDWTGTRAAGFDGMAIYDPYYAPPNWPGAASRFSEEQLLFSFNINPGFDGYPQRPPFGECFTPFEFEPPIEATGWGADARQQALAAGRSRILESLRTSLGLQLDPRLTNARRGFFVTYINSFNEWHEGTCFEPAADFAALTPAQRAIGYHNPDNGRWRLQLLQQLIGELRRPAPAAERLPAAS